MYTELMGYCDICDQDTVWAGTISASHVFNGACTCCGWEKEGIHAEFE